MIVVHRMGWSRVPASFRLRAALLATLVWIALRAVLAVAGPTGSPHPFASALLVGVVGTVVLLDMRRMKELVFLANLGATRGAVALTAFVPPLLLDLAARLAERLLGGS